MRKLTLEDIYPPNYQPNYEVKYNNLITSIKMHLKYLEPWYKSGKVGSVVDAINALKSIDKEVNR